MKAVVILCCFLAFYQVEARIISNIIEDDADFEPEEEECITELSLDREEIKTLTKDEIVSETDPKLHKFFGCYFQKTGAMNTNGVIDYNKVSKIVEKHLQQLLADENPKVMKIAMQVLSSVVTHCENKSLHGNTPGETAVKVHNCINEQIQEQTQQ